MPRMKILSSVERVSFDKPPVFNSSERKRFFEFSSELLDTARRLRSPGHRVGFLLACGYFKAVKKFFSPHNYHQADIEYVARRLKEFPESFIASGIPETSRRRHRQHILAYFGYHQFDRNGENCIRKEICHMGNSHLKPKLIFWRCIDVLNKNRIQTPNYDQLSKHILTAFNQRKKDLAALINKELGPEERTLLDGLFE